MAFEGSEVDAMTTSLLGGRNVSVDGDRSGPPTTQGPFSGGPGLVLELPPAAVKPVPDQAAVAQETERLRQEHQRLQGELSMSEQRRNDTAAALHRENAARLQAEAWIRQQETQREQRAAQPEVSEGDWEEALSDPKKMKGLMGRIREDERRAILADLAPLANRVAQIDQVAPAVMQTQLNNSIAAARQRLESKGVNTDRFDEAVGHINNAMQGANQGALMLQPGNVEAAYFTWATRNDVDLVAANRPRSTDRSGPSHLPSRRAPGRGGPSVDVQRRVHELGPMAGQIASRLGFKDGKMTITEQELRNFGLE